MGQNKNFLSIHPLPALLTPLPLVPFATEEITGYTNEAAKESTFLFFLSHVLLFQ